MRSSAGSAKARPDDRDLFVATLILTALNAREEGEEHRKVQRTIEAMQSGMR